MQGYIICSENMNCLVKDFFKDGSNLMIFYPHKKLTDADVFTEQETDLIFKLAKKEDWKPQPRFKIPAKYENNKVTIMSKNQSIEEK